MSASFNAAEWLIGRQITEGRGDKIALEAPDEVLSYTELAELVGRVAAGLRSLGLRRDDRVVFIANDDVPMFVGILAAFHGGFVAVPLSTMLGPTEVCGLIEDCGASVVIASDTYGATVAAAAGNCPELRHIVWDGDGSSFQTPAGIENHSWADLVEAGAAAEARHRDVAPAGEDAWALWLYTSGTTGKPKGAMHRHLNIKVICTNYAERVLGIRESDRCLSVAKLFFAYGIGNSMFFPLYAGATSILEPQRPTPTIIQERIERARPTLFFGVPTFYAALVNSTVPDDLFEGVRLGASAGEALPEAVQSRMKSRFGLDIIDGLGSTECLHIFVSNTPQNITPGTSGRPVPGYDIELRDIDGALVPDGQPGNLFVRGGSTALGYWRRTQATQSVFQGEWVNTGDSYVRAPDGAFTCLGRSNELLKAGGIWVSPYEVEERLLQHEAVLDCAVVALKDENDLDKPCACLVTSREVSPAELEEWCRGGLAPFKRPRSYVFVTELPKTATGKLQRGKVREMVQSMENNKEGSKDDRENGVESGPAVSVESAAAGIG